MLQAKITLPMAIVGTGAKCYKKCERKPKIRMKTFGDQDAAQRVDERNVDASEISAGAIV